MKTYFQKDLSKKGDCVTQCLNTILQRDDTPHFLKDAKDTVDFWRMVRAWLNDFGLSILSVRTDGLIYAQDHTLCIIGGQSLLYEDGFHATVGVVIGGRVRQFHDPNPNNTELIKPLQYYFLVRYE